MFPGEPREKQVLEYHTSEDPESEDEELSILSQQQAALDAQMLEVRQAKAQQKAKKRDT